MYCNDLFRLPVRVDLNHLVGRSWDPGSFIPVCEWIAQCMLHRRQTVSIQKAGGKPDFLAQLQAPSPVLMMGVLFCLELHRMKLPMGLKSMALTPARQPVLPNRGSPLSFSPVFSPGQWRLLLNLSPRLGSQCLLPEPAANSPLKAP